MPKTVSVPPGHQTAVIYNFRDLPTLIGEVNLTPGEAMVLCSLLLQEIGRDGVANNASEAIRELAYSEGENDILYYTVQDKHTGCSPAIAFYLRHPKAVDAAALRELQAAVAAILGEEATFQR